MRATVQVGPAHQAFWAVLSRGDSRLRERTHTLAAEARWSSRRGGCACATAQRSTRPQCATRRGDPRATARPRRGVALDLALQEDAGIEALCPHGRGYVWTRKQAGIPARGTVALDGGPPRTIEALAVVDDTAGYHARVTEWRWAAGVGVDPRGRRWRSISSRASTTPQRGSERAVWVAGSRTRWAVHFAPDLSRIESADGSQLRFSAEAQRSRRENLLLVRSDYRAPFGTFAGTLPGGVELAHGMGVVEHHRARW